MPIITVTIMTTTTMTNINLASQTFGMYQAMWRSRELNTKLDRPVTCAFSKMLYVAETWTLNAGDVMK